MVDAAVMEVAHVKSIIGSEGIGVNDAVGLDPFLDDGQKSLGFRIGNNGRKNLPAPFKKAKNGNFACGTTASPAFANTSKVALIRFNFSREFIAWHLAGYELSEPHVKLNRRVGLNLDDLGCSTCRSACDKVLNESALLGRR